jgi:hypothetical protein
MRFVRFSIAGLMGAVLTAALGLTALRSASETWAGVALLATCGVLGLAVVGVVSRAADERAWWLGFALFGWGYLVLALWSPPSATNRVKDGFLQISCDSEWESELLPSAENPFVIVGHCLLSVVAAAIGAVAAPIVAGRREHVT